MLRAKCPGCFAQPGIVLFHVCFAFSIKGGIYYFFCRFLGKRSATTKGVPLIHPMVQICTESAGAVKSGMSKNKASKHFNIPQRTLNRHLAGKVIKPLCNLGHFVPVLGAQLEVALEEHMLEMQQMIFGLSCNDVRKLAFQIAVEKGLEHPFSSDKQQAGKAWLHDFYRDIRQFLFATLKLPACQGLLGSTSQVS